MTKLFTAALVAAFALCSYSSVSAQDAETLKASEAFLESLNMAQVLEESLETSLDPQMEQFKQMGMGPEGIKELKAEMLAFMKEVMSYEELKPDFIKIYANAFTASELKELTAFYQTPLGAKTMKLMPTLMAQGMELGQAKVQENSAELQARLVPIFEKHLAKP